MARGGGGGAVRVAGGGERWGLLRWQEDMRSGGVGQAGQWHGEGGGLAGGRCGEGDVHYGVENLWSIGGMAGGGGWRGPQPTVERDATEGAHPAKDGSVTTEAPSGCGSC